MSHKVRWARARPLLQWSIFALFFFLFLSTTYRGKDLISYPVNLFLRFDPLLLLATLLSTHRISSFMLLALITVAFTLLLGRAFCGWICPLGTLNDLVSSFNKRKGQGGGEKGYRIKYYVLFFLLASSLFTVQLVGLLDPISLLIRSLTVAAEPVWNLLLRGLFDFLYDCGIRTFEPLYRFLQSWALTLRQPFYHQALFIALIFAVILLLNLWRRRFWCTHLCPLGALLGLIAAVSPFGRKVTKGCNLCGLCVAECPSGAASTKEGVWKKAECFLCGRCQLLCPQGAIDFGFLRGKEGQKERIDLRRREVIGALAGGAIFSSLLLAGRPSRRPGVIRPPGSLPEEEFLSRCVRCGECMKVCLTGGLQPALFQAGLEGIWTPVFDFRLGYCQYSCTLCTQVCPTGAIRRLTPEEKAKVRIGIAHIDRSRCIPYAQGINCIVCEEHCPTPKKAISFVEGEVMTPQGRKKVKLPTVDPSLCIGCGICEYKCPLKDRPAIVVTPLGESREGAFLLAV